MTAADSLRRFAQFSSAASATFAAAALGIAGVLMGQWRSVQSAAAPIRQCVELNAADGLDFDVGCGARSRLSVPYEVSTFPAAPMVVIQAESVLGSVRSECVLVPVGLPVAPLIRGVPYSGLVTWRCATEASPLVIRMLAYSDLSGRP